MEVKTRIAILLISLISIPLLSAFAGSSASASELPTDGISASMPVTLNFLGCPGGVNYVEVGFSRNPIDDISDYVVAPKSNEVYATAYISDESIHMEDKLHVYWKLFTGESIKASLSMTGALHNVSSNQTLDWSVLLEDEEEAIGSGNYSNEVSVVEHNGGRTSGSRELDIWTDSINTGDLIPGEYKGELRLSILSE